MKEKKQIVILGGGFAGVRAALDLNNYLRNVPNYEIILIDRRDYQTYHAGLYEAATTEHELVAAKKVKRTVTIPLADIFVKTHVKVFKAYIEHIDTAKGQIVTDSRILSFDYLVVAMGSVADFYGIPGLDKYGFTLKSLEDAVMIRNRIEEIVLKKNQAQIVIGGGGFSGVEFAGELHNLLKQECRHHEKDPSQFKILIVEGAVNFLPGISNKVSAIAASRLSQMGVEAKFSSLVTEAGRDYIMLNMKERINCDLLIWTGGVRSVRLPIDCNLELDKKDRVITSPHLNLPNCPNVFVIGDNLCFIDPQTKRSAPQTAQEAIRQGSLAAKNIFRSIRGKNLLQYHPGALRYVIPVSGKFAVMYSPNLIVLGFGGWVIRKLADLKYFLSILPFSKALKFWLFENKIFMKND